MQARRVRSESIHHLRHVTRDGDRLLEMSPIAEPEARMQVTFEGLTEAQQLKALAAFPGGGRFTLLLDRKTS